MSQPGTDQSRRKGSGFRRAAKLVEPRVRNAGEKRGFAVSRLLTHWADIAGPDLATLARPVEVSYARSGFGATLTVLTTGAQAPLLEMQKETLRDRVNACYGYAAISRIRITQTAATGFAEPASTFAPAKPTVARPNPAQQEAAAHATAGVGNADLRHALEELGARILSQSKS